MPYNPWDDAGERYPDIHIEWQALGGAHALWAPTARVILVNHEISRAERRCALAHELAHIDTGDRSTSMCWFSGRQESNADKLAARRLVCLDDLVDAYRWCTTTGEAAEALDVTVAVLALRAQTLHPSERGRLVASASRRELTA